MRPPTLVARQRLYLLARVVVARHYRRPLTLAVVAGAIASSPRQLQRAYEQFGEISFSEDLLARRMSAAAELLIDQRRYRWRRGSPRGLPAPVAFRSAFRRHYGLSPARFRESAPRRKR